MEIRLARDLDYDSIVDGEGIRTVIWTQGCGHKCPMCHNPETHSFSGGFLVDTATIKEELSRLEHQDGITLSGGDPLYQVEPVLDICKYAKSINLNVWCYTGFLFDDLLKRIDKEPLLKELLQNIDVLVDGEFMIDKKSFDVIFRGSSNQRIIDVKESLRENKPIELEKYKTNNMNNMRKFARKTYV